MKRLIAGLAAAGVVAVSAVPASAQARGYVGLGGGISIPTGNAGDVYKMGWLGQLIAGITAPSGRFGGRIDGTYIRHSVDEVDDASTTLLGANGDLVFSPGSADSKFRPYLLGGVGFFNVKSEVGSVEGDSETEFAYNFGAGFRFGGGSNSRMSFFVEGRYISIQTEGNSTGLIPISIGIRWGGN